MFRKEVTYIFEIPGREPIESDVYVDIFSGRRFDEPSTYSRGLDYKGTGDEYKTVKAELLHIGEPRHIEIEYIFTETDYYFRLPDVNEYAIMIVAEGGYEYEGVAYLSAINH